MMSRTRVFIVTPQCEEDKRHDVCTHDGSLSVHAAYFWDKFDLVRSFQSEGAAVRHAQNKFGVNRVKVI